MENTNKLIFVSVFSILFIAVLAVPSLASAHIYGFDPSYTNYTLTKNVTTLPDGSYKVDAEFVLCQRNLKMNFTRASKEGIAWCSGTPEKCCRGGYNASTGECNTLSVGIAHQVGCSNFGSTDPIKSCYRSGMMYPQEAGNYIQIIGQSGLVYVADHPTCSQYGSGKTGAWVANKSFNTNSLDNYIVSAGAEFYNGDDDFSTVPIAAVIRPTPVCTPHTTKQCDGNAVYWYNSCNAKEGIFEQCLTNQTCSNGSCVDQNITCTTSAQCGTNGYVGLPFCMGDSIYKNYKSYTCNNQGTVNSYCSSSPLIPQKQNDCTNNQTCANGSCVDQNIHCTTNVQCGASEYVGSPFCMGDSIYKNYKTWTCNNQGTVNSYCSSSPLVPQKQNDCAYNQTCENGSCTNSQNCTPNSYQRCEGNNLYWYDSCNNRGSSQYCSNGCSNNACQNNNCTQNSYQRCSGSYLYWYDSCNNQQGSGQYCQNGCSNNSCQNNPYNPYGICTYHAYKLCQGNNIYWYDSCGNNQGLYSTCSNGLTCQYGQCVNGYVPPIVPPINNYVSHYRISCYGNSLYWYDSLGALSGLNKSCVDSNSCTVDSCSANKCVNTLRCDGSTCATGSADYNNFCSQSHCGNGTCEQTLGETISSCPNDCKENVVVNTATVSFFAKQDAKSTQWQKSVQIGSNGTLYFMISVINNSANQIDNVTVLANIPSEITSLGNLKINDVAVSGDIVSGVSIGSLAPSNAKSVTFEGKTQNISTDVQKQAIASVAGATQTDSVSIDLKAGQVAGAAVSNAESTTGFWEFLKRWYLWILVGLILIFLFIVVFKRLSSES